MIDTHCHVLAGLDDGPEELDESLAMCEAAANDGIQAIVATPHMLGGVWEVECGMILERTEALNAALREAGVSLQVYPGAEVYIRDDLSDLLQAREVLTMADTGKYLLVELPTHIHFEALQHFVFTLRVGGATPVFSHIERNRGLHRDLTKIVPLVEAGAVMQITGHSLFGLFGSSVRLCAERLVENRLAHLVVSDSHGMGRRTPVLSEAVERIAEIAGPERARQMSVAWPRAVIEGDPLDLPEPEPIPPKNRSWFSFLFGS